MGRSAFGKEARGDQRLLASQNIIFPGGSGVLGRFRPGAGGNLLLVLILTLSAANHGDKVRTAIFLWLSGVFGRFRLGSGGNLFSVLILTLSAARDVGIAKASHGDRVRRSAFGKDAKGDQILLASQVLISAPPPRVGPGQGLDCHFLCPAPGIGQILGSLGPTAGHGSPGNGPGSTNMSE